jgi:hypothetical protein
MLHPVMDQIGVDTQNEVVKKRKDKDMMRLMVNY